MTAPRTRAPLLALAAVVALAACEITLDRTPQRSGGPGEASPSAASSVGPGGGPFQPATYPAEGPAPCEDRTAYAGTIRRITAESQFTVIFELCAPDPAFRARVAGPSMAIQDSAWLAAHVPDGSILARPNGTGPYRLDHWVPGSEVVLARNDAWWAATPPRAGAVAIVWDTDARKRLADLTAGTLDGIDRVAAGDVATVLGNPDLVLLPRPGLATAYVGLSNRAPSFGDVRVREAVAFAIDRRAIVAAAFPPGSEAASHFASCSVAHGCTGAGWPELDRPAARDLLAAAGLGSGFATTITYAEGPTGYLPDPAGVAEVIRSELAEVGITATVQPQPFDAFIEEVDAGRSPGLFLLGTEARFPDVSEFLDRNLGGVAAARFGAPDAPLTAALGRAARAVAAEERAAAYTAVNDALRKAVPLVPLAHAGWHVAFRADVAGAQASPLGTEWFAGMTPGDRRQVAWSQAAEPAGLYCADETDVAALRVCGQIGESLFAYRAADAAVVPSLATGCEPSADLTAWTCQLRRGVRFHDGSRLDAGDVVLSFAAQWDAAHALHRGRTGEFRTFIDRFRGFLNGPGA